MSGPVTSHSTIKDIRYCVKLIAELVGRYHRLRFGLDFRLLRFPVIVGPGVRTPGVAHRYACIVGERAQGRPAETYTGAFVRNQMVNLLMETQARLPCT